MGQEYHNEVPRPPGSRYYKPPADVKREFAKRLALRIREQGMNQSELARKASLFMPKGRTIARDLVSNYIRGNHIPRPANLAAMARALDCQPDDLLPPGSVPSADTSKESKLEMRTLEGGAVWLRINTVLPWEAALQIVAIVKEHESKT